MQATSDTWKALWASESALLESMAIIGGAEYLEISPPVISRAAMQGGLSVGNVVSATCGFSLRAEGVIPKSAEVRLLMRLTDGERASEWLPAGTFYISRRTRDPVTGVLTLECYDALLKANALWEPEPGDWPRPMEDVAAALAGLLGLEQDGRNQLLTGGLYEMDEPEAGTTVRDALGVVAAANGGSWVVSPAGRLRLVPVRDAAGADEAAGEALDVLAVIGGIAAGEEARITGVRCTHDDVAVLTGDDTGVTVETSASQALALELADRLIGMRYRPFELKGAVYDPAAELGDYVRYGEVASVLCAETATLGPGFRGDISAPEPAELADEYPYIGPSDRVLTVAKAYAREAAEAYAGAAAGALDESLNQRAIFNRLTGDGKAQALLLSDGKLYLNATYVNTGTLSADVLRAGVLTDGAGRNRWNLETGEFILSGAGGAEGRTVERLLEDVDGTVTAVTVEYATGGSAAEPPEAGWSAAAPDREAGAYVWQRTVTTYASGETRVSDPVNISGADGEAATVLRIDSSRGTVFKNNLVSTVLSAVIYHGGDRITGMAGLRRAFGAGAYLQWRWQRMDEDRFGVVASDDARLGDDGFTFTLSPEDVDVKVTFMCELIVE